MCGLDCNNDNDVQESTYLISSLIRLSPLEPGISEGVGGLVGESIKRSAKRFKSNLEDEELCSAMSCQIPRTSDIKWVKCESPQCEKWFHIQCVGLLDDTGLPRRWFCGCAKFTRDNIFG